MSTGLLEKHSCNFLNKQYTNIHGICRAGDNNLANFLQFSNPFLHYGYVDRYIYIYMELQREKFNCKT